MESDTERRTRKLIDWIDHAMGLIDKERDPARKRLLERHFRDCLARLGRWQLTGYAA
jgi:hypothetical protein